MHLQSALFTPPARITASVPQFVLNIGMRFPEHLDFQFLLFYFLSLSVDFAPRVLLTESFAIFYTLITELKSEIRTSSYETLTGPSPGVVLGRQIFPGGRSLKLRSYFAMRRKPTCQ